MSLPSYERLLHVASVQGQLTNTRFQEIFDLLYPDVEGLGEDDRYFARFQAIRHLEALGHCEYDYENRRLIACPPALVLQSGYGLPQAILTGSRTPAMIDQLRHFSDRNRARLVLKEIPQPYHPVLPAAITLKGITREDLAGAANHLGIEYALEHPAPAVMLDFSRNIQQVYGGLMFDKTAGLNWPERVFSTASLAFRTTNEQHAGDGLVEYTNRVTRRKVHWLWSGGRAAAVERDWGRYIALHLQGANILLYNPKKFQLAVPSSVPLPALLARAATLKSGLVPVEKRFLQTRYLLYSSIDPNFASLFAQKLGQSLKEI